MDNFRKNIVKTHGILGEEWLLSLDDQVDKLAKLWGLTDLIILDNLNYNYVLRAICANQPVILKISYDKFELSKEYNALKHFECDKVVKILNYSGNAILLEQIVPGYSLKTFLPSKRPIALKIICDLVQEIQSKPLNSTTTSSAGNFPHIRDHLKELDKVLFELNSFKFNNFTYPESFRNLLQYAIIVRDRLLKYSGREVLLHGDLHHDNIVWGNNWKLIDPKGVIGYAINEMWAFITDIENDTKYIAEFFEFELQTLRDWYFVHLMLSCCFDIEDNRSPFFFDLAIKAYEFVK